MVLKQLRLSRLWSQEQLATMSGLSVRTIQRIESGHTPSLETLKSLAAVLQVDVATLQQESYMPDQQSIHWQRMPRTLRWLFAFNFFSLRPQRAAALRVEIASHLFGFGFCALGLVSEPALVGGLLLLLNAYLFRLHLWLGDKYAVWYDPPEPQS